MLDVFGQREVLKKAGVFWEECCARYPQIAEQAEMDRSPSYEPSVWSGTPLPELGDGPPFKVTFRQFLGGEYRIVDHGDQQVLVRPFPNVGIDDRGKVLNLHAHREYVIGRARYADDEDAHLGFRNKYSHGWVAMYRGEVVGCNRIGWVWVRPDHRKRGLGLALELTKWTTVPYLTFYMKYAFKQRITPPGFGVQKALYRDLVERGFLENPGGGDE